MKIITQAKTFLIFGKNYKLKGEHFNFKKNLREVIKIKLGKPKGFYKLFIKNILQEKVKETEKIL